jgi:hypothetical protein
MRPKLKLVVITITTLLVACEKDDVAQQMLDGKAKGSACRHAGRAIEDCFAKNQDAIPSAVFDGWKEMNDYMRENRIAEVLPKGILETNAESGKSEEDGDEDKNESAPMNQAELDAATANDDSHADAIVPRDHKTEATKLGTEKSNH